MNRIKKERRIPGIWWLILLTSLLLAAHFSRANEPGWLWGVALFPLLLLRKEKWLWQTMSLLLLTGAFVWLWRIYEIAMIRIESGMPWLRMSIILGFVVILTLFSAWRTYRYQQKKDNSQDFPAHLQTTAFFSTFVFLLIIQWKAPLTMLLLERFAPGFGAFEIFIISYYAGWLTGKMIPAKETAKWRFRIWTFFSMIFFSQFVLGLTVSDIFMQTGQLHLPIPAVIVGGPLYRGGGLFMVILLLTAIVLAGPAWCSHLCYVGALDQYFSRKKKKAKEIPVEWRQNLRLSILGATIVIGLGLNFSGVSSVIATIVAIVFALASIAVMIWYSSREGVMIHCTSICPIGWVTTFLGRINPFRVKINDKCTDCGACTLACRYASLNKADIEKRTPNISCTLCGDCIGSCPHDALEYRFLKTKPVKSRYAFLVLIITLHSVFLAIARV